MTGRHLRAAASGRSGRTDLSELLSNGLDVADQRRPSGGLAPSEVHVWVMTVNAPDGGGYISVHTTEDGARAKLDEIVERWGLGDLLEADELDHSIGYLPVNTP